MFTFFSDPITQFLLTLVVVLGVGLGLLWFGPKSWRTVILHAAVVGLGLIGELLNYLGDIDWKTLLANNPQQATAVVIGLGVLGLIYRYVTTGPIGSGDPKVPKDPKVE